MRHASLVDMFDTHITPTHGPCLAGGNIIKLCFNNETILSKNLLITLSVVIIQNSCHLWRLSFNVTPELSSFSSWEANMPYLVKRSSTSRIKYLISLRLLKAFNYRFFLFPHSCSYTILRHQVILSFEFHPQHLSATAS